MRITERNNTAFTVHDTERSQTRSFGALAIWQYISLVLWALVTGVFWRTWLGLSRSMPALTPETFLEVGHTMIGNLGTIMAILMPVAILAALPVLYLLYRGGHSGAFYLSLAGFVLFVVTLLITLIVEVPIDNQIEGWTVTTLPANWQALRDRWEWFHAARSWIAVLAFALLLGGTFLAPGNSAKRSGE